MGQVAIAASSVIAAAAGARIAEQGGNAVDAAMAAALVSMTTEPGVVSLAGGGFVTVWAPGEPAITIDGNVSMPGRGLPVEKLGRGTREVSIDYGGGVSTLIGHGSVATPAGLAACSVSAERFGVLPWAELVAPAYEHARDGFPLPKASHNYLVHAAESIYGWHADSRTALFRTGRLAEPGERIEVPHLADSLKMIAEQGADTFYRGELAARIVRDMQDNDGVLTAADLEQCRPIERRPLEVSIGDWHLAINPPPAVGGVTLTAMLKLMGEHPRDGWSAPEVARAANVQAAVLGYRRAHLDLTDNLARDAATLFERCESLDPAAITSPSTIHVSCVDASGLACAATISSGYGAGVMPPGTGIWMNNTLGEIELNRRGLIAGPPGTPLASNMAPAVARGRDGGLLAIGSPGADRITSAMMMTLLNLTRLRMSLADAIAHPRLHVEFVGDKPRIAVEPGMDTSECELPVRHFDEQSMFFGGVGAALRRRSGELVSAADSRRAGGARIAG